MSGDKSIALIGNLGRGAPSFDGQTLRTRLILTELNKRAASSVISVDTAWISRRPVRVLLSIYRAIRNSNIVLIMPGERGLSVLLPFFQMLVAKYGCTIHYIVVGGWLPDYVNTQPGSLGRLRRLDGIYVQSSRMVTALQSGGLQNVHLLPNFKNFPLPSDTRPHRKDQLSLVFLSRIVPEKGVEHCFDALGILAKEERAVEVSLDLWGMVSDKHKEWFADLLKRDVPGVEYKGALNPEQVVGKLRQYDAMVFPTWYRGEGFPGVIVDAFAAGIPVIASDWHDNPEYLTNLETGILFECGSLDHFVRSIRRLIDKPELLEQMKSAAAGVAKNYHADVIVPPFFNQLGIEQK